LQWGTDINSPIGGKKKKKTKKKKKKPNPQRNTCSHGVVGDHHQSSMGTKHHLRGKPQRTKEKTNTSSKQRVFFVWEGGGDKFMCMPWGGGHAIHPTATSIAEKRERGGSTGRWRQGGKHPKKKNWSLGESTFPWKGGGELSSREHPAPPAKKQERHRGGGDVI